MCLQPSDTIPILFLYILLQPTVLFLSTHRKIYRLSLFQRVRFVGEAVFVEGWGLVPKIEQFGACDQFIFLLLICWYQFKSYFILTLVWDVTLLQHSLHLLVNRVVWLLSTQIKGPLQYVLTVVLDITLKHVIQISGIAILVLEVLYLVQIKVVLRNALLVH